MFIFTETSDDELQDSTMVLEVNRPMVHTLLHNNQKKDSSSEEDQQIIRAKYVTMTIFHTHFKIGPVIQWIMQAIQT